MSCSQTQKGSGMQALEEPGRGRVLVVDAGASMRCAVLGDNLAAMGVSNGWSVRCP
jgi:regulator of ribonuclease activity A